MARWRWLVVPMSVCLALVATDAGRAQAPTGAYVPAGTWEETAAGFPPARWSRPGGLDLTASGHVYVVDRRLRRVEVLDVSGAPVTSFGRGPDPEDLAAPEHVAVDVARDRVYVADPGAGRVAVYDGSGTRVGLWGAAGTASGVAVAPDGRVVVSDAAADVVRVFAPDGSETGRFGGLGRGPAEMDDPAGVHVTDDGIVWVADRGNSRVLALTIDGSPVAALSLDAPQVEGAEPLDVAVDAEGVWVATDLGVVLLDADGRSRSVRGMLGGAAAAAVAVLPEHGLFAAVTPLEGDPGVWRYLYGQRSGDPRERWGGPIDVAGFFDGLEALAIGDDGLAYLLDVPPRVQRLSLSGAVLGQIAVPDPIEVDADAAGRPYAVVGDTVRAFEPDGAPRWEARVRPRGGAGADVFVVGVAWDEHANRVLALDGGSARVHAFGADGREAGDWALRPVRSVTDSWTDMVVTSDGTLYALDAGNRQVRGWSSTDALVLELDLAAPGRRFDVAADGTVFVLSWDGWARRYGRDGSVLAEWDASRLDLGRGSRPADIAVDALGRVLVVDALADVVTVFAWDPAAVPRARPEVESGCDLEAVKSAHPSEIALGEAVEVSLVVRGTCAGSRSAADIALLVDESMDRSRVKAARLAVESFVDLADPASDLVAIQPGADASGRLTNDLQYLRRVARRIDQADAYDLGAGIGHAEGELFGIRGRRGVKKVMVILFGGKRGEDVPYWEWWHIQRAAGEAKRRGAEIFCIALGRDTDVRLLYDIASTRAHVVQSRGAWELDAVYRRIADEIKPSTLLRELVITDEVPENMELVPASSLPPAAVRGRVLEWRLGTIPPSGAGVRFRLRPLDPGEWPTNVVARGDYVDADGVAGSLVFPVPVVRVRAPTPMATATRLPTATARPSVPPSATPAASESATPSPTEAVHRVFLPLALRERCDPKEGRVDVALVIDASTSMLEPIGDGRTKLQAATDAAGAFLDRIHLERDQATIVVFHQAAELLQPLTSHRDALDAALARIEVHSRSRIDLGIATAREELLSARRGEGSRSAMVVLTDGRANPSSPDEAVAEARSAKERGITVFTIGVGDDLDLDALERVASRPEYFYRSPDGRNLSEIYVAIAGLIPCPPEEFWGQ